MIKFQISFFVSRDASIEPRTSRQFNNCFELHDSKSLAVRADAAVPAARIPWQVNLSGSLSVAFRSKMGTIPSKESISKTRAGAGTRTGGVVPSNKLAGPGVVTAVAKAEPGMMTAGPGVVAAVVKAEPGRITAGAGLLTVEAVVTVEPTTGIWDDAGVDGGMTTTGTTGGGGGQFILPKKVQSSSSVTSRSLAVKPRTLVISVKKKRHI